MDTGWLVIAPQLISLIVAIIIISNSRRRLNDPLIKTFVLLVGAIGLWALDSLLELLIADNSLTIFFGQASYIFIASVPVFLLLLIIRFIKKDELITKKNKILISIIPAISVILAMTSNYHQLFYARISIDMVAGQFTSMSSIRGPFFWVFALYSYSLIIYSLVMLTKKLFEKGYEKKQQVLVLILSIIIPFGGNFLYIFRIVKTPYDLTTLLFIFTQLLLFYSIRVLGFLEIMPVARSIIFNELKDAIIVVDSEGLIRDLNESGVELLKIYGKKSKDEVINQDFETIFKSVPVNLKKEVSFDCSIKSVSQDFITEIKKLKKGNKVIGRVVTIKNITNIKRAEQLKKINNLRNQFLNRVTHELRQPLMPIIGYTSQVIKNSKSKKVKESLTKVLDNTNHLKQVINKALSLVSLETGRELRLMRTNLKKLINQVLNDHKSEWKGKKLIMDLNDCELMIDPIFKEVIYNLLDNAYNYGGDEINLTLKGQDNHCELIIKDDGPGISLKQLKDIEEGLYLAKEDPSKLRKGFGVGLSLVKLIVEAHKGTLKIKSKPGKGLKIIINLPKSF